MPIPVYMRNQNTMGAPRAANSMLRENVQNWQPTRLLERHRTMIRLYVKGMSYKEVARQLGVSTNNVRAVLTGELAQDEIKKLRGEQDGEVCDVAEELAEASKDAVGVMREALSDPDLAMGVRLKAASEVLDRAGFGKVTKVHSTTQHSYTARIGIASLKERANALDAVSIEATADFVRDNKGHTNTYQTDEIGREIRGLRDELIGSAGEAVSSSIKEITERAEET